MKYRKEIDGLRAIAVVPVILFHSGIDSFAGGFVGVDIFFVISGYLICSLILSEQRKGQFALLGFYERRARRILPALYFVITACVPMAWVWLMPHEMQDFTQSVFATALFGSNFLFWLESGYFTGPAELKPLLHTWSLAVEEQYYLIFPVFMLLKPRLGDRWIVVILVVVAVLSLGLSQWGSVKAPSANFYLLPTRGWELLIGVLAAFYLFHNGHKGRILGNRGVREVFGTLGILLIAYSVFTFDHQTPFPSFWALLPTTGTLLVILFAHPGSCVGSLLGIGPIVGIGLISYSLYLWHFPLFAFAKHRSMSEPTTPEIIFICFVTISLSYVSWRFVEQPFRQRSRISRRSVFASATVFAVLLLGFGSYGHMTRGFENVYVENRLSTKARQYYDFVNFEDSDEFIEGYSYGQCFYGSDINSFAVFPMEECLIRSEASPNLLIVGDSHAAHFSSALRKRFPSVNVMQATVSGCRPLLPYQDKKRCTDFLRFVFDKYLVSQQKIDAIILSGHWRHKDSDRLKMTAEAMESFASAVFIFGPTVEYHIALPQVLARNESIEGGVSRESIYLARDRFELDEALKRGFGNLSSGIYISVIDTLCDSGMCTTLAKPGVPIVWDYGHFTLEGSLYSVSKMHALATFLEKRVALQQ